ncbi:SAM-dependent methyltransferase [Leptolyngbya ohadii]|uniref:SAM-dependent methyltransferase n=1 Tax=Leptolyngbya ohadii TaxID=1962290 RepID=UPI000B59A99E|nr:class I SAM-dependent methyltransferase [Leptolyngbya ohadii]
MRKQTIKKAGIVVGLSLLAISAHQVVSSASVLQRLSYPLQAQTPSDTPAQPATEPQTEEPIQAPYVPTPQVVVDKMLEMAAVGPNDLVYDLGSGDGRVVITAAQKFGTRGIGIEIDPELIALANENAAAAGVSDRVQFREQDLFATDFSDATVVTLYLLQDMNLRLRPILLRQLKPGTRIISHSYTMGDWKPEDTEVVQGPSKLHIIYKWTVPEVVPPELLQ